MWKFGGFLQFTIVIWVVAAKSEKQAYVTVITTPSYAIAAEVLAKCLIAVQSNRPIIAIVQEDVFSKEMKTNLTNAGFDRVLVLPEMHRPQGIAAEAYADTFRTTYFKFHVFNLVEYSKIVFLDADIMVLSNLDHLFDRQIDKDKIAAVADICLPDRFNSGVMIIRPCKLLYKRIIAFSLNSHSIDGSDQGTLNTFFKDWYNWTTEHRLPLVYNIQIGLSFRTESAWNRLVPTMKILHFSSGDYKHKPWRDVWPIEVPWRMHLALWKSLSISSREIAKNLFDSTPLHDLESQNIENVSRVTAKLDEIRANSQISTNNNNKKSLRNPITVHWIEAAMNMTTRAFVASTLLPTNRPIYLHSSLNLTSINLQNTAGQLFVVCGNDDFDKSIFSDSKPLGIINACGAAINPSSSLLSTSNQIFSIGTRSKTSSSSPQTMTILPDGFNNHIGSIPPGTLIPVDSRLILACALTSEISNFDNSEQVLELLEEMGMTTTKQRGGSKSQFLLQAKLRASAIALILDEIDEINHQPFHLAFDAMELGAIVVIRSDHPLVVAGGYLHSAPVVVVDADSSPQEIVDKIVGLQGEAGRIQAETIRWWSEAKMSARALVEELCDKFDQEDVVIGELDGGFIHQAQLWQQEDDQLKQQQLSEFPSSNQVLQIILTGATLLLPEPRYFLQNLMPSNIPVIVDADMNLAELTRKHVIVVSCQLFNGVDVTEALKEGKILEGEGGIGLLHMCDERGTHITSAYQYADAVFRHYSHETTKSGEAIWIPNGPFLNSVANSPGSLLPFQSRQIRCLFVGARDSQKYDRMEMLKAAEKLGCRLIISNSSADDALSPEEYGDLLRNTRFALCPSGVNVESLRLYEAMNNGAIPIVKGEIEMLKQIPLLKINDWDELGAAMDELEATMETAQRVQVDIISRWRQLERDVRSHVSAKVVSKLL